MRWCGIVAGGLTALTSQAHDTPKAPAVMVSAAWIRALPGDLPAAGYMTLVNSTDAPLALTHVQSPAFGEVMLHASYATPDGTERMRRVNRLSLPPHREVLLAPGNDHLMLMQPKATLRPGDSVTLELEFSDHSREAVKAVVRPASYQPK